MKPLRRFVPTKLTKRFLYKSFELGVETKDKSEATDWVKTGFRVRVYDGRKYLGDLMDNGDVFPALMEA